MGEVEHIAYKVIMGGTLIVKQFTGPLAKERAEEYAATLNELVGKDQYKVVRGAYRKGWRVWP